MKRKGILYEQICSIENLRMADAIAQKGKGKQPGVIEHNKQQEKNILGLHHLLLAEAFQTSPYTTFPIYEPKEREIFRLPYYPDRIVHHAVMNILEPIFVSIFSTDSYSCIKGKGVHAAGRAVRKALRDVPGTQYCLKLDIKKFYPSVDHDILKALLLRKFKDNRLLKLLDGIIESAPGLPIGNYLSQYLANFYLTYFDHWIKEEIRVRYYFRYADDIVILSNSKEYLHELLRHIATYLCLELNLQVKRNYQVFPVAKRGIDFLGYIFFHTHTLLRKSIKKNFARMMATSPNLQSMASYKGWAKHANCKNLIKTLCNEKVFRPRRRSRTNRIRGPENSHR